MRFETKPENVNLDFDLLNLLRGHNGLSRKGICKILNRPRTTVFEHLVKLEEKDLVFRQKSVPHVRRPEILWYAYTPMQITVIAELKEKERWDLEADTLAQHPEDGVRL